MSYDVAILGAGAAGMMAAATVGAQLHGRGKRVVILEKNVRPGIKVLVCGGGRCNFTNAGTIEFLIEQFGRNGRFLTPALRAMDNEGLRDFFANLGVPSHIEHDGKVYPDSNQAKSVVDALVRRMREVDVEILAGTDHAATSVEKTAAGFAVATAGGQRIDSKILVLAIGGMSYQRMGTVGDGYRIASHLGHSIVTPRPAIVGLIAAEAGENGWIKSLQGLAMRDVAVSIHAAGKTLKGGHGEGKHSTGDMLFAHFGISGPAVLNPSEIVAQLLERQPTVDVYVDFARHITHEQAHAILRTWQREAGKKRVKTMLIQGQPEEIIITSTSPDMTAPSAAPGKQTREAPAPLSLPVRLAEKICELEGIAPEQICAQLTSTQMHKIVERIKQCRFTITATRGFKEAMVTAGGIKLSEVNPATYESKLVPNLYLTGEVLDLTGPSGGYNLQLAFSTGYLAGLNVADKLSTSA